ncbi:MAG TPA: NYN domain-containing protein [Allosphingosinicella sp.]|nr:NYN domain-containing protein [Allosphingosinicella sp.]
MKQFHSALFIDYDNVRTELDGYDPALAARFSNKPLLWLEALESSMPLPAGVEAEARRIVSRRCYASPRQINNYRRNFTQTGFEVIDCPPLTTHLKNSADIYIVMDIVDYLQRYPHIEEFIILSADADFVPVLNRLRKELKKSVIFTSYNTTAAYRNCSDRTIEADFFAEHLAVERVAPRAVQDAGPPKVERREAAPAGRTPPGSELGTAIRACLGDVVKRGLGQVPFAGAAPAVRDVLPAELTGNWAGYKTFTALLEQVDLAPLEVDWARQMISDPDFQLELVGWDASDRDRLGEFVTDIAQNARKPVPILRPAEYAFLFETLAEHFQGDEPGTFTDAVNAVAGSARERGFDIGVQDVRFIAAGISMQEYRFTEAADAPHLAALWRAQVFRLCGDPDWLIEAEEAALLVDWIHSEGEDPDEARQHFLRRAGGGASPEEEEEEPATMA